jgi:hypothetical protein
VAIAILLTSILRREIVLLAHARLLLDPHP